MESWPDLARGESQSVVGKDKIREVQKCQLTEDLELKAKSLDLIQQEQLILEQEGGVIKMAFAEDYFSSLQRHNCSKRRQELGSPAKKLSQPLFEQNRPEAIGKKGQNDEYVRCYKARGFKSWFLAHLFQNHLECLLKIHFSIVHAQTL